MTEALRTEAFGDESSAAQQDLEWGAEWSDCFDLPIEDGPPPRRRLDDAEGDEDAESDDFGEDEDEPLDERGYWGADDEEEDDPGTFIESADGEGPTISEEDEFAPSFTVDDDEEPPATDYAAAASGPPPPAPTEGPSPVKEPAKAKAQGPDDDVKARDRKQLALDARAHENHDAHDDQQVGK